MSDVENPYGPRIQRVWDASVSATLKWATRWVIFTTVFALVIGAARLTEIEPLINTLVLLSLVWVGLSLFVLIGWVIHMGFTAYLLRRFTTNRFSGTRSQP